MKAIWRAVLLSAVFVPSLAIASAADHELSLGGIALGEPESSVLGAFGRPTARTVTDSDYLPVRLSFPHFTVLLDEHGVGGMISSDGKLCTPKGVCPGMFYASAQRAYGADLVTEQVDGSPRGYVYGDGCWLEFATEAERIKTIEVACSP